MQDKGRQMILAVVLVCAPLCVAAQDLPGNQEPEPGNLEAERSELQAQWVEQGLVKPGEVEVRALALLDRPPADQSEEELQELANDANAAANFVGFILEEYQEYYRDNYRYDFVQKKVAPFHDAYVNLSNRLKTYRNLAYFNLGKKAIERGDEMAAFFLFRDAYRLSNFTQDEGDHRGVRYLAELEMKRLLGIEDIGTFTYWK